VSADGFVTRGLLANASGSLPVVLEPAHQLRVSWRDAVHGTSIRVDHMRVSWIDDDGRWRDSPRRRTGSFDGVPWREIRVQAQVGGETVEVWHHPREGRLVAELGCRGSVSVSWPDVAGSAFEFRRLPEGSRRFRAGVMSYANFEPGRWELRATTSLDGREFVPIVFDVIAHETTSLDLRESAERVNHDHPHEAVDR
jgi:hypothetical protein